MADNITLNATTTVGQSLATKDVSGVQHQKELVEFLDGATVTEVGTLNPLPVEPRISAAVVDATNPVIAQLSDGSSLHNAANPVTGEIAIGGSLISASNALPSEPVVDGAVVDSTNPIPVSSGGTASTGNSSTAALAASATFTGTGELNGSNDVLTTVYTDQDSTLYMEFSNDDSNWDSSLTYNVKANTFEIHRLVKGSRYFRARLTNDSSTTAQTFLRLQTVYGTFGPITAPGKLNLSQDSDALFVRSRDTMCDVSLGRFSGITNGNKFGKNTDVDTGTTPEDMWTGGGLYTFPAAAETLDIVSDNANDTAAGTGAQEVTIFGLDANYLEISEAIALNGLTTVTTTNSFLRVNKARVTAAGSGGSNAGILTCTNTTTANTLFAIIAGSNSTNLLLFTVAANKSLLKLNLRLFATRSGAVDCEVVFVKRDFGGLFVEEDVYSVGNTSPVNIQFTPPRLFAEKTDFVYRVTSVTQNNTTVAGGFDYLLVEN